MLSQGTDLSPTSFTVFIIERTAELSQNMLHTDRNTDAAVFPFFLTVFTVEELKKTKKNSIWEIREAIKNEGDVRRKTAVVGE